MRGFEIAEPRSITEAFDLLAADDPATRPIGGGTALMLMMKAQLFKPTQLVSLRGLGGRFTGVSIEETHNRLRIGAMTTLSTVEHSPDVARLFPVIGETMKTLANVRVRNVATIGGNLAHGDPHLDLPPVWAALGAEVVIINPAGERVVAVEDLYAGYYETNLRHDDLIAELHVPVRPGWRSTYVKVTTRSAHDWPALGIAISLVLDGDRIVDIRAMLSAATDRPTRLRAVEGIARGARIDEKLFRDAGETAAAEVEIEDDSRGSGEYKRRLLRVHLGRALHGLSERSR